MFIYWTGLETGTYGFFLDSLNSLKEPSRGTTFLFLLAVEALLPDFRRWIILPDFSIIGKGLVRKTAEEFTYRRGKTYP